MKLTCSEIYTIVNALEARLEYLKDENIFDEIVHGETALNKMKELGFEIKLEELKG